MKKTILAALLLGALSATSAFAVDFSNSYAGLSMGRSVGQTEAFQKTHQRQPLTSIRLGTYLTPDVRAEVSIDQKTGGQQDYLTTAIALGYRIAVPDSKITLYPTAGAAGTAARVVWDTQQYRWSPLVGLAVEYPLAPQWTARLDYRHIEAFGTLGRTVESTALGVQYAF